MPNSYTCIDAESQLALGDQGQVLAWPDRQAAKAARAGQPDRWSIITVGSRRYHAGVVATFQNRQAQPRIELQK